MSKAELAMEIASLGLDYEVPEQRIKKNKKTSRHMSEEFKKKRSEIMKKLWSDPEWRERQLVHLKSMEHTGHPQTPETRKKMRLAWTEERKQRQSETLKKAFSEAKMKEKLSNRTKGYIWVTNGEDSKLVPPDQIPEGWQRGRA